MTTVMMNAANLAYRKALKTTRDKTYLEQHHPLWMQFFAEKLPDNVASLEPDEPSEEDALSGIVDLRYERMQQELQGSTDPYEQLAWFIYSNITCRAWFEGFVMLNILLVGVATGADLENDGADPSIHHFAQVATTFTSVVFAVECALKIVAEGRKPLRFFMDKTNGSFNTFDFVIVVSGILIRLVLRGGGGAAIGAVRMLRLVRLLTFIKGVQQLRVIVAGLIQGVRSVVYIVMLLFLIIYLFAILGCLFFGANDPARFGTVPMSMFSLFQVSTLASWTSIAYTSWFGCDHYLGAPYALGDGNNLWSIPIDNNLGHFVGFQCRLEDDIASPITTFVFFSFYIVLTSWVIMSLFIGVISMGMFEAFEKMKEDDKNRKYMHKIAENKKADAQAGSGGEGRDPTSDDGGVEIGNALARLRSSVARRKVLSMKEMIDNALDDMHDAHPLNAYANRNPMVLFCTRLRDSSAFTQLVTWTIVLVGLMIGVETDQAMRCERHEPKGCGSSVASAVVVTLAQTIFTVEAVVKIVAEFPTPMRYFMDEENGSWNCMDAFIVVVGFIEMSPAAFVFEAFPVVMLRMLRLLRVFRLAKTLPRLRSIVEALISGFSAVGWICVLIVVINYIMGCMCMLMFKENDPFHFGSIGRSMFSVLRIETLDTWDQVVLLSMFGCENYPAAYPFTLNKLGHCTESYAFGWLGAAVFFFIVIVGSYILPTVLIGIVAISFDTASRRTQLLKVMNEEMEKVLAFAKKELPEFFTRGRIDLIRCVFDAMDADSELSLDINELAPFYHYTFIKLFGVNLNTEQVECLFHLMDMDGDTELMYNEFVMFVAVVKQIEHRARADPEFASEAFPGVKFDTESIQSRASWKAAMARMDEAAPDQAWDSIFNYLNTVTASDAQQMAQIRGLFADIDTDGGGTLSVQELGRCLKKTGALINEHQTQAFFDTLDLGQDNHITVDEFVVSVFRVRDERRRKREEATEAKRRARERREKSGSASSLARSPSGDEQGPDAGCGGGSCSSLLSGESSGGNGGGGEEVKDAGKEAEEAEDTLSPIVVSPHFTGMSKKGRLFEAGRGPSFLINSSSSSSSSGGVGGVSSEGGFQLSAHEDAELERWVQQVAARFTEQHQQQQRPQQEQNHPGQPSPDKKSISWGGAETESNDAAGTTTQQSRAAAEAEAARMLSEQVKEKFSATLKKQLNKSSAASSSSMQQGTVTSSASASAGGGCGGGSKDGSSNSSSSRPQGGGERVRPFVAASLAARAVASKPKFGKGALSLGGDPSQLFGGLVSQTTSIMRECDDDEDGGDGGKAMATAAPPSAPLQDRLPNQSDFVGGGGGGGGAPPSGDNSGGAMGVEMSPLGSVSTKPSPSPSPSPTPALAVLRTRQERSRELAAAIPHRSSQAKMSKLLGRTYRSNLHADRWAAAPPSYSSSQQQQMRQQQQQQWAHERQHSWGGERAQDGHGDEELERMQQRGGGSLSRRIENRHFTFETRDGTYPEHSHDGGQLAPFHPDHNGRGSPQTAPARSYPSRGGGGGEGYGGGAGVKYEQDPEGPFTPISAATAFEAFKHRGEVATAAAGAHRPLVQPSPRMGPFLAQSKNQHHSRGQGASSYHRSASLGTERGSSGRAPGSSSSGGGGGGTGRKQIRVPASPSSPASASASSSQSTQSRVSASTPRGSGGGTRNGSGGCGCTAGGASSRRVYGAHHGGGDTASSPFASSSSSRTPRSQSLGRQGGGGGGWGGQFPDHQGSLPRGSRDGRRGTSVQRRKDDGGGGCSGATELHVREWEKRSQRGAAI